MLSQADLKTLICYEKRISVVVSHVRGLHCAGWNPGLTSARAALALHSSLGRL